MNLYGIYKRNTIDDIPEMNALLDDTRDYCHRRGLHYVTCADVPGYMNDGCSIFPEYVACNGYSCDNAIKRAKEVLKMQGYKEMYAVECTLA